jgi:hypothetical protein
MEMGMVVVAGRGKWGHDSHAYHGENWFFQTGLVGLPFLGLVGDGQTSIWRLRCASFHNLFLCCTLQPRYARELVPYTTRLLSALRSRPRATSWWTYTSEGIWFVEATVRC